MVAISSLQISVTRAVLKFQRKVRADMRVFDLNVTSLTAVAAVSVLALGSFVTCQDNPVVDTIYGQVEGAAVPLENGDVIDSFLAIPYATPPVGELRFEV